MEGPFIPLKGQKLEPFGGSPPFEGWMFQSPRRASKPSKGVPSKGLHPSKGAFFESSEGLHPSKVVPMEGVTSDFGGKQPWERPQIMKFSVKNTHKHFAWQVLLVLISVEVEVEVEGEAEAEGGEYQWTNCILIKLSDKQTNTRYANDIHKLLNQAR